MKYVILAVGAIAVLLGGLWTLQGLGIVQIEPVYCVADCEAVEGVTPKWAVIGLATLIAGVLAIVFARRR